jgi:hypothetical protein
MDTNSQNSEHSRRRRAEQNERRDMLAVRYLDGDDSLELAAEVRALLPNEDFRRRLAAHSLDSAILFEFCGQLEAVLDGSDEGSIPSGSSNAPSPRHPIGKTSDPKRVARWSTRLASLGVVAALLVVGFFLVGDLLRGLGSGGRKAPVPTSLCAIKDVAGEVQVSGQPAAHFKVLGAGQSIRTIGALSSARLVFADGTIVHMAGDASVRVHVPDGQKQVFLDYGHPAASVTPQPKRKPLLLFTPTALLKVLGTEFAVSALTSSTELSVSEGVVLIEPRNGGQAIPVKDGEFSEARLAKILPPYEAVSVPSRWSADFDVGLPEGWTHGQLVDAGEDESDKAISATNAVKGARKETATDPAQKKHFEVRSNEQWANGLVRIEEDSELTYRIRMDRPQWYQVFLCVRANPVKDGVWSWNYEYQEADGVRWEDVTAGQWRDVRVPLTKFKRLEYEIPPSGVHEPFNLRGGAAPPINGLVVWILFTTQDNDRGMVVDDVAIEPASPSKAVSANHSG